MESLRSGQERCRKRRGWNGIQRLQLIGWYALALALAPGDTVQVTPASDLQSLIEANPPGTVFLLHEGTYPALSVVPRTGNHFVGQGRVVLDGGDSTSYAFRWSEERVPDSVHIVDLIVEHYAPEPQLGPILAGWHVGGPQTVGWQVEGSTIRLNATAGIRVGDGMVLRDNRIVMNGQIGITGIAKDLLVENNDISLNNPEGAFDILWEAGGAKFVLAENIVVRNNRISWNKGPGLWTDINSRDVLYEGNIVSQNTGVGILHEISGRAIIEKNRVSGNGEAFHVWGHGAGVLIHNSRDVDVRRNRIWDNARGVIIMHQDRLDDSGRPLMANNIAVYDNDIAMSEGFSGFVQDVGDPSLFTTERVSFRGNRYILRSLRRPFAWGDRIISSAAWTEAGQDVGATFQARQ